VELRLHGVLGPRAGQTQDYAPQDPLPGGLPARTDKAVVLEVARCALLRVKTIVAATHRTKQRFKFMGTGHIVANPGRWALSSVGLISCCEQAFTFKFRLLSIRFTSDVFGTGRKM